MLLNLGSGSATSSRQGVVNIDWSMYLRLRRSPLLRLLAMPLLSHQRRERLRDIGDNVLPHDLSKGIPFEDASVDAVYASHLLEHLDRNIAVLFLREIRRVLKPGGIVRIVVPDLEFLVRRYLQHLTECEGNPDERPDHDDFVAALYEQSVRKIGFGTTQQSRLRRFADRIILGDARRRGETHQWMYDRFNLAMAFEQSGLVEPSLEGCDTSGIADWGEYVLDRDQLGRERHPNSLYMEARAPDAAGTSS